jgi:putative transposase
MLMRSGAGGNALFMRRILTRHGVAYNRRHCRHGHLFQNCRKSIICEEDTYFTELVRYFHLTCTDGELDVAQRLLKSRLV